MLPESSSQGHLFIKVRNCCLNPFIAANVAQAAVMDSGWGCDTNVGARAPSWVEGKCCLGLPGLLGLCRVPLALSEEILASPKL